MRHHAALVHFNERASRAALQRWLAWQIDEYALSGRSDAARQIFVQRRGFRCLRRWPYVHERRSHTQRRQLDLLADADAAHILSCRELAFTRLQRAAISERRLASAELGARVRIASLRALAAISQWSVEAAWIAISVEAMAQLLVRRLSGAYARWRRHHARHQPPHHHHLLSAPNHHHLLSTPTRSIPDWTLFGAVRLRILLSSWRRAAQRWRLLKSAAPALWRSRALRRVWGSLTSTGSLTSRSLARGSLTSRSLTSISIAPTAKGADTSQAIRRHSLNGIGVALGVRLRDTLLKWRRAGLARAGRIDIRERAEWWTQCRWVRRWAVRVGRAVSVAMRLDAALATSERNLVGGAFHLWKARRHRRAWEGVASEVADAALCGLRKRRGYRGWQRTVARVCRHVTSAAHARRGTLSGCFRTWARAWALVCTRRDLAYLGDAHLARMACRKWCTRALIAAVREHEHAACAAAAAGGRTRRKLHAALEGWQRHQMRLEVEALAGARRSGWRRLRRAWRASKDRWEASFLHGARLASLGQSVRIQVDKRLATRGLRALRHACICVRRHQGHWRTWAEETARRRGYARMRSKADAFYLGRAVIMWQCTLLAASLARAGRAHRRARELDRQRQRQELWGSAHADEDTLVAASSTGGCDAADGRRAWRRWLRWMRDRACASFDIDACRRRRLGLHLAKWARWWWMLGFIPALSTRVQTRLAIGRWLVWHRHTHRIDAAMLDAAVTWHGVTAGYRRALRAFARRQLLVHATRAANEQHMVLGRLASLAEAVERWRRPKLEEAAKMHRADAWVMQRACEQWCRFVWIDAVRARVVCWRNARLHRWVWHGWRAYCTLPRKYERLLREVHEIADEVPQAWVPRRTSAQFLSAARGGVRRSSVAAPNSVRPSFR